MAVTIAVSQIGISASLRLVSAGAVTDGVTLFYLKSDNLFIVIVLQTTVTTRIIFAPFHHPEFVQNSSAKNIHTFLRVSPPWMVSLPRPLVTPLIGILASGCRQLPCRL